jgi:hypothetical protein
MEKLKPKSWLKKPVGKHLILGPRRGDKEIIVCMVGK